MSTLRKVIKNYLSVEGRRTSSTLRTEDRKKTLRRVLWDQNALTVWVYRTYSVFEKGFDCTLLLPSEKDGVGHFTKGNVTKTTLVVKTEIGERVLMSRRL